MTSTPIGTEFMGAGRVYIRNMSGNWMHAFVTAWGGSGSDSWLSVSAAFGSGWDRKQSAWERIAFKDDAATRRVWFYRDLRNVTTYVTFHSFNNVEIYTVPHALYCINCSKKITPC